jgi:hypothetical protein
MMLTTLRRLMIPIAFLSTLLMVFVAAVSTASAVPFYVRSIATAQTSGLGISDPHFFTDDTGQVQTQSNSAGPFSANSSGAFYNFHADADVLTEIGAVHGSASASANSTGPNGGSNASAQGQWSDTITIISDTLPSGTSVSFLATMFLHRTISGAPPASAGISLSGPFGLSFNDSLSSPNAAESVSTLVNTTIGSVLSATSTFTMSAGASGIAPFSMSGSVSAENTAVFSFTAITPGASYTTASGVTFLPEPPSALLMLCGLLALGLSRASGAMSRRSRRLDLKDR